MLSPGEFSIAVQAPGSTCIIDIEGLRVWTVDQGHYSTLLQPSRSMANNAQQPAIVGTCYTDSEQLQAYQITYKRVSPSDITARRIILC